MPRQKAPLSLEHILLGMLSSQPQHGYELFKQIEARSGPAMVWSVKQAQLYAMLDKLESLELLTSERLEGSLHPDRRQYRLTEAGRTALYTWMRAPVERMRAMRQEFLARLYFAQQESPQTAHELISRQVIVCHRWLNNLQGGLNNAPKGAEGAFERMVLQFRMVQTQGFLFWLDACVQEIERQ